MNDSEISAQLLEEVRKLNRLSRASTIWFTIWMIVVFGFMISSSIRVWRGSPSEHKEAELSWGDIRDKMDRGHYDEAISDAKGLVQKTPKDWYGHASLAYFYLSKGDLREAEKEYATAFRLWPIEDNEKTLKAIRKRIDLDAKEKTGEDLTSQRSE